MYVSRALARQIRSTPLDKVLTADVGKRVACVQPPPPLRKNTTKEIDVCTRTQDRKEESMSSIRRISESDLKSNNAETIFKVLWTEFVLARWLGVVKEKHL